MAIEIIPDKICPHCGENKWRTYSKRGKSYKTCQVCRTKTDREWKKRNKDKVKLYAVRVRLKYPEKYRANGVKWRRNNPERIKEIKRNSSQKLMVNLSDSYIRQIICTNINRENRENGNNQILHQKNVSQEIIEKYREGIKVIRKQKEMNKLGMKNVVTTKEMTAQEKQRVYTARHEEKKRLAKLQSVAEYEAIAAIGVEEQLIVEEIVTKQPEMDIVTEFKKLEERRIEILNEVENFNNYVESLKIKLS